MGAILTVGDLVRELLKEEQSRPVVLKVAWSGDTAVAKEIDVEAVEGKVHVKGWLPNCGTELEIQEETCDECGVVIPEDNGNSLVGPSLFGDFHKDSCSLNPKNAVEPSGPTGEEVRKGLRI